MAMVEKYRPFVVVPYTWVGDPSQLVRNTPFETSLRSMIARIKDTPPQAVQPIQAPASKFLEQGVTLQVPLLGGPPRAGGGIREPRE
jgi:hypothetical protein